MELPSGFPDRLKPRLEAKILALRYKYPLAGDFQKRILETISAFVEISCKAVRNREWTVELAHEGLKHFALELSKDHAWNMHQEEWWAYGEFERYVNSIMKGVTNSTIWLQSLRKLANLAESKSLVAGGRPTREQNLAETRQKSVSPILSEKGWTPSKLADKTGVDTSVIYDYLKGKSHPRPETRKAMAEALGIDLSELPE